MSELAQPVTDSSPALLPFAFAKRFGVVITGRG